MTFALNSRILLSAASILAAATLVIGATFAFFSDSETSEKNVFAAGTLDLVLCDDDEDCPVDEGPEDGTVATFGGTNMAPGDCLPPATLNIRNTGTVAGDHVDISITNDNDDMDDFLRIDTLTYDGSGVLGDITDGQPNTFKDLQDFEDDPLTDLALIDTGVNHPLVVEICLDESAPDSLQGDSNTMVMTVFLNQGPHSSEI